MTPQELDGIRTTEQVESHREALEREVVKLGDTAEERLAELVTLAADECVAWVLAEAISRRTRRVVGVTPVEIPINLDHWGGRSR